MRSGTRPAAVQQVRLRIEESIAVKQQLLADSALLLALVQTAQAMVTALKNGGRILFFGNGGSAADAQHLAAEFVGRYLIERRPLPAIALTVNTSALTAIGNDYGYETVFARQIVALGAPGDIAVGITTSGKSPNVLAGLKAAKQAGLVTVALTGQAGKAIRSVADHCLAVPSQQTPRIQEAHILLGHIVCELVEDQFAGN
jgi:D-sedoheptulose 7-phosphate isomerase